MISLLLIIFSSFCAIFIFIGFGCYIYFHDNPKKFRFICFICAIFSIIMISPPLISFFTGFFAYVYFHDNPEKFRFICFIIRAILRGFFYSFFIGFCVSIYILFNRTIFLEKNGFITKIYYRVLIEGYAIQSVMVFSIVLCLNYRFIFMDDYFVYMNNSPTSENMSIGNILNPTPGHIPLGSLLNSTRFTPPPDSSGPSTTNITTEKPIIRLVYCQCYSEGDYFRIVNDTDGRLIRSVVRDELRNCEIRQFELDKYLLNLESLTRKARGQVGQNFGIYIPYSSLSDGFDYKQSRGTKIEPYRGNIFVRITVTENNSVNRNRFSNIN